MIKSRRKHPELLRNLSFLVFIMALSFSANGAGKQNEKGGIMETIKITSSAFNHNEAIPSIYTCDGEDISPPVQWENIPQETRSLVLIADDPDAPSGTWVHWVCYDIPPDADSFSENTSKTDTLENGAIQGKNDFGKTGYGGPCPPGGTHRYFFKLYALDKKLELAPGKTKKEVLKQMEGHVTASGELVGTYIRK